jgi:hypothetical protein
MTDDTFNPRARPGSNQAPDYAQEETRRLAADYVGLMDALASLRTEAEAFPRGVNDDAEAVARGAVIKKLRDLDSRAEGVRVLEKEPHLRRGNAVDSFFNTLRDQIGRRVRTAKPGLIDVLQGDINEYQERKIAAERARQEAERREAERAAREAAEAARKAAAEAAEREAAIARARSAQTQAARQAEAEAQQRAADLARAEAQRAAELAEEARLASLVKPAEIARVRGSDQSGAGVTLTVAKEPYAMLVDREKVDMNALRPYFNEAEIEKALRGWAKAHGHKVQMPGAEIGFRNKGVTR